MSSKRKRGQRWCKADSEHAANSTSGCKYTESKCTIVFADIGKEHPDIKDQILTDVREPLSMTEVKNYADIVDADAVVRVNQLAPRNGRSMDELAEATWSVLPTTQWKCEDPNGNALNGIDCEDSVDMIKTDTGKIVGRVVILRQASQQIRLILVRIIKGKGGTNLFIDEPQRKAIAFALLKELEDATGPTLILGNPGFTFASFVRYKAEYESETSFKLSTTTEIFTDSRQDLICIANLIRWKNCTVEQIDRELAETRLLIIKVTTMSTSSGDEHPAVVCPWDLLESPTSSDDEHPAAAGKKRPRPSSTPPPGAATLTPRAEAMLRMFSEVPDNAEHGKKELARLMLNPIQTHERMTDDGMSVTGPVDIETSVRCFETALKRLQTAREEVGVFCDNQILTDTQFEDAQRWLQKACFEKYFMRNQDLVKEIRTYDDPHKWLSRGHKASIRSRRRSAFKSWKRSQLGNTALWNAVLMYGFAEPHEMCEFMKHFLRMSEEPDAAEPEVDHENREQLRRQALAARKRVRRARYIRRRIKSGKPICAHRAGFGHWTPTARDLAELKLLDSGELTQICERRNKAYGHGSGAQKSLPVHEVVHQEIIYQRW